MTIHPTALIDVPPRPLQGARRWHLSVKQNTLPPDAEIGPYCSIGQGVRLGKRVVFDAYSRIDCKAEIGDNTLILYRANVGVSAKIGNDCVIGGSVSEGTVIEDRVRSFGLLIHSHTDSVAPWDDLPTPEPSPTVRGISFVGHGAMIIGDIEVGPRSYVCAGATTTRTVPPFHIAFGTNRIVHFSDWKGPLSENPMFLDT